jgi:hypothetical protein
MFELYVNGISLVCGIMMPFFLSDFNSSISHDITR